jgi:hypothetical protein
MVRKHIALTDAAKPKLYPFGVIAWTGPSIRKGEGRYSSTHF